MPRPSAAMLPAAARFFSAAAATMEPTGVAAAATLAELGWETRVYAVRLGQGEAISRLYTQYRMKSGREVLPLPSNDGIPPYDVVVDALLGTGARFGLEGDYLRAARIINRLGESGRVVAVDLPTGVSADTGRAMRTPSGRT